MDINDNQQINTFVKGMNTDLSDALMDSSQYRYAENLRLSTDVDENTGELHLIEGNKVLESYNKGKIKAMIGCRDIIVVVDESSYIYKHTVGKEYATGEDQWPVVFDPDGGSFFNGSNEVSLVIRYESSKLINLYVADGIHSLMSINIADGNLVVGFDGVQQSENIYLPQLSASITSSTYGSIPPAKIQYIYRLYKVGGSATTLSQISRIITLYKNENQGYDDATAYASYSVKLDLKSDIKTLDYDKMQIFRISYQQVGQVPITHLIYDNDIISTYIDSGRNEEETDIATLLSYQKLDIHPKVIESKENYLFAANFSYTQDDTDKYFEDVDTCAYSSGQTTDWETFGENRQFQQSNILNYDEQYWHNKEGGIGGTGKFISWKYAKEEVIIDNNKTSNDRPTNSLRRGEVYRYGAILYRSNGTRSSVKWIADIMSPDTAEYIPEKIGSYYKMYRIGIRFNVNWNAIADKDCENIEIVRVPRSITDKISISQGIIGSPYRIYKMKSGEILNSSLPLENFFDRTTYICPTGLFCNNKMFATALSGFGSDDYRVNNSLNVAYTDNQHLVFASPESVYSTEEVSLLDIYSKCILQIKYNNNIPFTIIESERHYNGGKLDLPTPGPDTQYSWDTPPSEKKEDFWYFVRPESKEYSGHAFSFYVLSESYGISNALLYGGLSAVKSLSEGTATSEKGGVSIGTTDKDIHDAKIDDGVDIYGKCLYQSSGPAISVYHSSVVPQEKTTDLLNTTYSIKNYAQIDVPKYDQFLEDTDTVIFKNNQTILSTGTSYVGWSAPLIFDAIDDVGEIYENDDPFDPDECYISETSFLYPCGSTGAGLILELDDQQFEPVGIENWKLVTQTANLKNMSANPYGGYYTRNNSQYVSYGYTIGKEDSQKDVFDGDCYLGIFVYNASKAWWNDLVINGVANCAVYSVPLESDIDLSATCGDLFTNIDSKKTKSYYVQDSEINIPQYTQTLPAYLYNTAYSSIPTALSYSSVEYTKISANDYDHRIMHSNPKVDNSLIDDWTQFQAMNYIDVDSRYGQITNMRLFKDKLLFWQEHATGIVSVNERTVLNDLDDNQIVLGTGGVLQRYDYISTTYGMKPNQYQAETQSNTTQYWWDGYNKEILGYSEGMSLLPLTKTKSVTNYINERQESAHPCLAFDSKYDEILAQVVNNETIAYNEWAQQFISVYTFMPLYRTNISNMLFVASENDIWVQNEPNNPTESYLFNEPAKPMLKYVINSNSSFVKTYDTMTFGGRFYQGSELVEQNIDMYDVKPSPQYVRNDHTNSPMKNLTFTFDTPLKQHGEVNGADAISVNEYDFRLAIPRNEQKEGGVPKYGNRMRGKTMQCKLESDSNSTDFSLQYIITKFRISWS